jgi:hypothetical protein
VWRVRERREVRWGRNFLSTCWWFWRVERKREIERNGEEWCQVVWYGMAGFPLGHAMKKQMIESKQDMHASHVLVLVMVTKMVA